MANIPDAKYPYKSSVSNSKLYFLEIALYLQIASNFSENIYFDTEIFFIIYIHHFSRPTIIYQIAYLNNVYRLVCLSLGL